MKKKLYILLLLLTCFLAVSPSMESFAATKVSFELTKKNVNLFIGGSKGYSEIGAKAPTGKYFNVRKYLSGFDSEKFDIKLKSGDKSIATVSNSKDRIYPKKIGNTEILVTVKNIKTGKTVFRDTINVIVKKNASDETMILDGIEDGDEFDFNESILVKLPNEGDTDLRKLECDDEGVVIAPTKVSNVYNVTFKTVGEFEIKAKAYQSAKYDGATAEASVHVFVTKDTSEVRQLSTNSLEISGGVVFEGMQPEDIEVYYMLGDIKAFFSSVESVSVKGETATVATFKQFEPGTRYLIICDGEEFEFVSTGTDVTDVAQIAIETHVVTCGKYSNIKLGYYTADGVNITKAVEGKLEKYVQLTLAIEDAEKGIINGNTLYMLSPEKEVQLTAYLEIFDGTGLNPPVKVSDTALILSKDVSRPEPTGNIIYSFEKLDDKYLLPGDKVNHQLALGDTLSLEVLIEYDDGTYKNFSEAGVTKVISANQSIAMVGSRTVTSGYLMYLNNVGKSAVLIYAGDKLLGVIPFEVGGERKASELKVELSKDKLNTNLFVGDYLIVKAFVYDQYGAIFENTSLKIEQNEASRLSVGEMTFDNFYSDRLIINGWDCANDGKEGIIRATVSADNLEADISFQVKDVPYEYDKLDKYQYSLKTEGNKYIDTAVYSGNNMPESTFVSVMIESDGYFVGEGIGDLLAEKPIMMKSASEYGVVDGESFYALFIENKKSQKETKIVGESGCVIPSYMDLEFAPYSYGEQLEEGEYTISLYLITGGQKISQVELKDSVTLYVYDSEPEIEVKQIAEVAVVKAGISYGELVKNYFKFYLDGEEITDYIVDADCNISGTGHVFFKTVTFKIPNISYGKYQRTLELGRLVNMLEKAA